MAEERKKNPTIDYDVKVKILEMMIEEADSGYFKSVIKEILQDIMELEQLRADSDDYIDFMLYEDDEIDPSKMN